MLIYSYQKTENVTPNVTHNRSLNAGIKRFVFWIDIYIENVYYEPKGESYL